MSSTSNTTASTDNTVIVKAAIYPPIGVMRVGNSATAYYIGPLTDNPEPQTDVYAYRDKTGALKRQAAQFRIYGLNADGVAVRELTSANADITWQAQLTNQKASWYEFQMALDIPEAANAPASMLRNGTVWDRNSLIIDGQLQQISGNSITDGPKFIGKFLEKEVYLGEMHTDAKGRLIMLGGHGKSENPNGDIAVTFANNEGWYDDTSDGPITATVTYNGETLLVDPAWVVCAPPDYAPMQKSVRTMWDLMRDVAVTSGTLPRPERPSFTKDILPIFERMTNLQWVNAGFAGGFGWGGPFNYTAKEWITKLNNTSPAYKELRRTLNHNFRRTTIKGADAPQLWPWLYGDALSIPSEGSPRQNASLSDLQLSFLDQWAAGDFDADYDFDAKHGSLCIDELPVAEQPDMLTKAAMDFCLADAFHPGCEMTWPMRTAGMYMAPFRLKHAPKKPQVNHTYYGYVMTSDLITSPSGPLLGGQVAGGITRWMAVPWQTDTASCRDGYVSAYDPYLPTFWPARVPNNILNETDYEKTINQQLPEELRRIAFSTRAEWLDDLPLDIKNPTQVEQINSMIKHFDKMAIVQLRPGTTGNLDFPAQMQVGITPSQTQEAHLLEKVKEELAGIADNTTYKASDSLTVALSLTADQELFTEEEGIITIKDTLAELVSKAQESNTALPHTYQLLTLLEAKEAKRKQAAMPEDTERTEFLKSPNGINAHLVRFRTYKPE